MVNVYTLAGWLAGRRLLGLAVTAVLLLALLVMGDFSLDDCSKDEFW